MPKERNETPVYSRNMGLKYRAEFNGDNQVLYEGWTLEASRLTSDAKWQIVKHTYTSGNLTATDWADGTDDFIKVWDLRSSYAY